MLTLQNFETQVDPVILQRGQNYFGNKAVSSLEETGEDNWRAAVEGTDTYQVNVTLKNREEIRRYACDCPYDGGICKHVVAVLLALREKMQAKSGKSRHEGQEKDAFENLLQQISLQEYQAFIRSYASKDKTFKTDVELYFAYKDDRIDIGIRYKELIRKFIGIFSDRGFIHYQDTFGLANEINALLQAGQDSFNQSKLRQAFAVASVVMGEMMKLMPACDDSDANIAQTIDGAIELIGAVAAAAEGDPGLQEQIFAFLKNKLSQSLYFDYGDFGYDLFDIFQPLAIRLNQADTVLYFLNTQLPQMAGDYAYYQQEYLLVKKIAFLSATGKTKEAENLIRENLDIVSVRKGEVDKALARQDYAAAKALIAGGIHAAESRNRPDTVAEWQKELLRLAELENDTETIRHYARHFAFDRGFSPAYYQQWKACYTPEQWPAVIEEFIAETIRQATSQWESQKGQSWQPTHPSLLHKLGPVYIQEQYWDRLLPLVQQENDLQTTLNYHDYLLPHYPAELLLLYLPAFEKSGHQANKRSAYARLVANMQMVMKAIPAGKEQILAVARSLKEQFHRRPAMIEELNTLLK